MRFTCPFGDKATEQSVADMRNDQQPFRAHDDALHTGAPSSSIDAHCGSSDEIESAQKASCFCDSSQKHPSTDDPVHIPSPELEAPTQILACAPVADTVPKNLTEAYSSETPIPDWPQQSMHGDVCNARAKRLFLQILPQTTNTVRVEVKSSVL